MGSTLVVDETTLQGLRDRAILSVGLQVGLRRSEIVSLKVKDLHMPSLWITPKGGRRYRIAINGMTHSRIRAYIERVGNGEVPHSPLFLPLRDNGQRKTKYVGLSDKTMLLQEAIERIGPQIPWIFTNQRTSSRHPF